MGRLHFPMLLQWSTMRLRLWNLFLPCIKKPLTADGIARPITPSKYHDCFSSIMILRRYCQDAIPSENEHSASFMYQSTVFFSPFRTPASRIFTHCKCYGLFSWQQTQTILRSICRFICLVSSNNGCTQFLFLHSGLKGPTILTMA